MTLLYPVQYPEHHSNNDPAKSIIRAVVIFHPLHSCPCAVNLDLDLEIEIFAVVVSCRCRLSLIGQVMSLIYS